MTQNRHISAPGLVFRFLTFALLLAFALAAFSQTETATLTGTITDPTGAVVSDASIQVTNVETGITIKTTSNRSGLYVVPNLRPGHYRVIVEKEGFKQMALTDLTLNVQDIASRNFQMQLGTTSESITVTAEGVNINMTDATVSTVVDRNFAENLPMNGRSFQTLINLAPGTVATKASLTEQGQFSVNGQRPNANYFTIDGVSANLGVVAAQNAGQTAGGSLPGFNAFGGTNNLVSVDAMQEFRIQTSSYAPEFGRTPGGQISIATRAGTNQFHGTLFDYFRNDALDANDWFANRNGLPRPQERQNDFGGVLGGRLIKDRTFFFLSYEGLRLRQPLVGTSDVPSPAARTSAPAGIRPFLNAYPLPNGPVTGNGLMQFATSFSAPSGLDAGSVRLDHTFARRLAIFVRYSYAPSETVQRGAQSASLNTVSSTAITTQTATLGGLVTASGLTDEARFNYSRNRGAAFNQLDALGGATPLASAPFPAPFTLDNANLFFLLRGGRNSFLEPGRGADNLVAQFNFVNNLSFVRSTHSVKLGIDFRRIASSVDAAEYGQTAIFRGVTGVGGAATPGTALSGIVSIANTSAFDPNRVVFNNFSVYGQDTWRATPRLILTYGLRWEINPAPSGDKPLITALGVDNPATMTLAPLGTSLYGTTYRNVAPRLGLAYQVSQRGGREAVIRGGVGLFYDLGTGFLGNAVTNFPYARLSPARILVPYPLSATLAAPPVADLTQQIGLIYVARHDLQLPRVVEWNAAWEQTLGPSQMFSISYVGALGRKLLLQQEFLNPNPKFQDVTVTGNGATSDYHALQLKFQRRLAHGLQALASYSLSHSIDIASTDSPSQAAAGKLNATGDRASSDFDERHVANVALTYDIPAVHHWGPPSAVFRDFAIDCNLTAHSATPVNVYYRNDIGFGFFVFRPDLVAGTSLYTSDSAVPGGRSINRAAFDANKPAAAGRQGTLGRNALRGFDATQVDVAVRREFRLTDKYRLQFRAELFNLLNHPNFADPCSSLTDCSVFGVSTTMLGRSLGSGGVQGGFNPLYQVGGPRSIQLAMKFQF